tara:strand:- start:19526 stop:20104 length:579 start_codon:yes stop_codon:yes gene_type:complete
MKLDDVYSSWLKASQIEDRAPMYAPINRVYTHTFKEQSGDEKQQIVIDVGERVDFPLNATNAKAIAAIYGDETDNWIGQQIILFCTNENAFGQVHRVIRIDDPRRFRQPAQQQLAPPPQQPTQSTQAVNPAPPITYQQQPTPPGAQPSDPVPAPPGPPPQQQPQLGNPMPPASPPAPQQGPGPEDYGSDIPF